MTPALTAVQGVACLNALRQATVGPTEIGAGADWLANATQIVLAHGGHLGAASAQTLEASFDSRLGSTDVIERALRCAQTLLAQMPAQMQEPAAMQTQTRSPPTAMSAVTSARPDLPDAAALRLGMHAATTSGLGHAEAAQSQLLAAAMARAAPAGRLCITHALTAWVRGQFDVEPPLPLAIVGRAQPLQICLLRVDPPTLHADARLGSPAPAVNPEPPLIGRDDELQVLQAAFRRLIEGGGAYALTLLADPGIGKSRLLRAFDAWAQARPVPFHALRARATPGAQAQPFGLLGQLLYGFCQIDPAGPPEAVSAQLESALVPWLWDDEDAGLAECHAHLLGHLIGVNLGHSRHLRGVLSDPAQIRQRALAALALLLRRLSAAGSAPLLLLIEDLHWADSESLDSLDGLLQTQPDLAILIVASSRTELAARRPTWAASAGAHRHLALGPLDTLRSRRLAADLLKKLPDAPPALLDQLVQASAGNPYGIEERIKLLIDQGVILATGDVWSVNARRWRAAKLPATLAGVLQARLALVPATERRLLQRASVIGPVFGAAALRALGGGIAQALPGLLQRDLALQQPGHAQGAAPSFNFKHALLQDLVYASLKPRTRRALHARLAAWLVAVIEKRGPLANDALGPSAHHFEQAGDDLRAAEQHARAAEYAHQRYAADTVMDHVHRGLALLDPLPAGADRRELRWRLLKARIRMLEVIGQRDQHRADLDALLTLANALDDDSRRAEAHLGAAVWAMFSADYAAMKASARLAMGSAARAGEQALRLHAMRYFASAHFSLGDWDAGQRLAHQCLAEARATGLRDVEAFCTNTLSVIASRQRDPVAGLHWDEQTLAVWRELGDRSQEAISLCNLGESWLDLGEPTQARRCLEDGARLARACGNLIPRSAALSNLSVLERRLGQGERAVSLARLALADATAVSAPAYEAIALQQLGEAEQTLGHHAAAEQAFAAVQAHAVKHKRPEPPDAVAGLAGLALAQGDMQAALHHVLRVLALDAAGAVAVGSLNPRRLALICHRVLSSAGDSRALAWLKRAHDELLAVAATLSDESLRDGFFNNIPDHRAILAAWALHEHEQAADLGSLAR